ncbi:hypothetical protein CCACVL1_25281 [Corchorus capsularis]|uniref:Uncharacterized protein n=1 Tax=Corchorus capsularis TaxID=210143 RepID=A0A1R3GLB6_COCAP|nr:hypothetical protein CCACVL1_25281 [Corchorus capsularis]
MMSKEKNCRMINDHKKIEEIKEPNINRKFPYKFMDVKDVNDGFKTAHMDL